MSTKNFKETTLYKKAFLQAMEFFEVSKSFPKEEKYSLIAHAIKNPEKY